MAQVFGIPSRNATEESFKQTKRLLAVAMVGVAIIGAIGGYGFGSTFPIRRVPWLWILPIDGLLYLLVWLIYRWGMDKMEVIDRDRIAWRKGAVGEIIVADTLEELPAEYVVINDVSKRFGNIDHVVIGPTGVYVIDTKNWKGTIKADGNGELLVNGRPVAKPPIKRMLGSVMDFQNKLKALAEKDYFVRGLMVFPNAYVEAAFGSTRHIHCLRSERVVDYLKDTTFANRLSNEDIERAKRATLQLAGMDERFEIMSPKQTG